MKHILTLLIAICLPLALFGQGKLVNSSEPKSPKWLNRNVDQYELIKVSYTSSISLQDAKNKAFEILNQKVVTATTRYLLSQSFGKSESEIRSSVEKSMFVKNISESSAVDIYWEQRYIRKQDMNMYYYYILYNFNDMEMKKAALEINAGESNTKKLLDELN